jgi:DNA gyrase inhibitor GyrI
MTEMEVRIVRLEPMKIASTLGFGATPEVQAWQQIRDWAEGQGFLDDLSKVRFFGFNNPDPSPGSPNYGYEQWITVGDAVESSGEVAVKDFSGGLYAVTNCRLSEITDAWKALVLWRESSEYPEAHHQWLEECLTPNLFLNDPEAGAEETLFEKAIFDLYLPVGEST